MDPEARPRPRHHTLPLFLPLIAGVALAASATRGPGLLPRGRVGYGGNLPGPQDSR